MDLSFIKHNYKRYHNETILYLYSQFNLISNTLLHSNYNLVNSNRLKLSELFNSSNINDHFLIIYKIILLYIKKYSSDQLQLDHKHYIVLVNDQFKTILFLYYIMFFYHKSIQKKMYLGMDYEFNNIEDQKKIGLCQICFFDTFSNKYVWVFNPELIHQFDKYILINYLFNANNITKILHGSDSLDMKYIYEDFLEKDNTVMFNFVQNLVDTRFLCEYYKNQLKQDQKCSIYDALLFMNIIDQIKYKELDKINKKMKQIYKIIWNVHDLDHYHLLYSIYDVIYLKKLYFSLIKHADHRIKYVGSLLKIVYYDKWHQTVFLRDIKNKIDLLNNYIVIRCDTNDNITLVSIYNELKLDQLKIGGIININYLRPYITLLLKYIVYTTIMSRTIVYSNKKTIFEHKLDINELFNGLIILEQHVLVKMCHKLIKSIGLKLNRLPYIYNDTKL